MGGAAPLKEIEQRADQSLETTKLMAKPDYRTYVSSDKWRSRHRPWLKQSGHRCSMFPWIRLGQVRGKYHPYDMHHATYKRLGKEKLWRDVLPLSPIAHDWVIHGILSGWKSAGKQKHYPNAAQALAHAWCRLPPLAKAGAVVGLGWVLIRTQS